MKTYKLRDFASVIRTKNAGPYELTMDVLMKDDASFEWIREHNVINEDVIAKLYHLRKEDVLGIVYFPHARAVKATIVRPLPSGALGERDVYGAQQHMPLADYIFSVDE